MNKQISIKIERIGDQAVITITGNKNEKMKIALDNVQRQINSVGEVELIEVSGKATTYSEENM